jgi:cobalamin biosynthesis protein CobD/CbiB
MALLLAPLRWLLSSIFRLAIFLAVLVAAYFLLLKPAIHSGEKSVSHSVHSLEKAASPTRLKRCVERSDGNVEKMKRCATKF